MSKLGTLQKSSSSSVGAPGQSSISTSSFPLMAGTSLPVAGSGRMAIVPPVETTTTVTGRGYREARSPAGSGSATSIATSPSSSSVRITRPARRRSQTPAAIRKTATARSETSVVAVPRA
jgi:hypothetical protein